MDSSSLGTFLVVTAASEKFFDRLENFIGSIHFWEPSQEILIYDLGLTKSQLLTVLCWKNVQITSFPFSNYPLHVRNIYNYAWKPILISLALEQAETILVLDSGLEIRQTLDNIKTILIAEGYFIATQSNFVMRKTHVDTFTYLNVLNVHDFDKPFCSGGIQGYRKNATTTKRILPKVVKCALEETCIAPIGAGRSNHNFDQSVLSIVVYDAGLTCQLNRNYFEGNMAIPTYNEREQNHVVLALRRWKIPKPYSNYVVLKTQDCLAIVLPANIQVMTGIIETTQSDRHEAGSKLVECLQKYQNDRMKCSAFINESHQVPAVSWQVFIEQHYRWVWVVLQKVTTCTTMYFWMVITFVFYVLYRIKYSTRHGEKMYHII